MGPKRRDPGPARPRPAWHPLSTRLHKPSSRTELPGPRIQAPMAPVTSSLSKAFVNVGVAANVSVPQARLDSTELKEWSCSVCRPYRPIHISLKKRTRMSHQRIPIQACCYILSDGELTSILYQVSPWRSLALELWGGCLAIVPLMVSMLSMICGTSCSEILHPNLTLYVSCSDHLLAYLRPFAQEGKIVEEADVTRFFETLKEKRTQVN